ncbi:sulfatase-like hydrolase/transferase [Candidatus Poribacteria bacterium]|nr:sulfatase-like hydrolase/transferase [Candidatus Poribacteria bacterium]
MRSLKRPNILIIHTDQQRWDTLRCTGNDLIHTPNLDKMASEGAVFTNCFTNNPVCMPSRMSLMTGQYPSALGCTCNGIQLPEDTLTVNKILKPYGYHTANIGKLHFWNHSNRDHKDPHPDYGFDTLILSDEPGCYDDAYIKWVESIAPDQVYNCRVALPPAANQPDNNKPPRGALTPYIWESDEDLTHTAFVASETCEYIKQHKDDRFFAFAGIYAPHAPINPPARFVHMYDIENMPLPRMSENDRGRAADIPPEQLKKMVAYYYALITHIDDQIGRIMKTLEEEGLRDNTMMIFLSDHGEHLGDHALTGKGAPGYDSCIHVPFLISYPGVIDPGMVIDHLVEQVDIVPTILDYCGIQTPRIVQGHSIKPALQKQEYKPRNSILMEFKDPFRISWRTVRTLEYKYCRNNKGREILFDLKNDPYELNDLANDENYEDILNMMRHEMLSRWFDAEKQFPLRTGAY